VSQRDWNIVRAVERDLEGVETYIGNLVVHSDELGAVVIGIYRRIRTLRAALTLAIDTLEIRNGSSTKRKVQSHRPFSEPN
jgi:hypothetical protein